MPWTKERLVEVARERLGGAKLVVVSNREPYLHLRSGDEVRWIRPAGGLVAALDPVMRAVGGLWVAHGSDDADRQVADTHGRAPLPPDNPPSSVRSARCRRPEGPGR